MTERGEHEGFTPNEIIHENQDDGASQSTQRSMGGRSASLLERIQRQRELEAATKAVTSGGMVQVSQSTSNVTVNSSTIPSVPQQHLLQPLSQQIQVPQYGPMPGFGNTDVTMQQPPPGTTPIPQYGYLNNAWNSFTQSMESTMMADKTQLNSSPSYENDEMHHALLPPTTGNYVSSGHTTADEYSISEYFLTFVKDVYGLFVWLPIPVRIVVLVGLLYIVVKFI